MRTGEVLQARQSLKDFSMEGKVVPWFLGPTSVAEITLSRSGVGICHGGKGKTSWTRDEAIEAARAILEYYGESP